MPIDLYWDSSFTIRTLEPAFHDDNGVNSPLSLGDPEPTDLQVPEGAKAVKFHLYDGTGTAEIAVSKTTQGGVVVENGVVTLSNDNPIVEIPLENITYVRISSSDSLSVSFMFLLA